MAVNTAITFLHYMKIHHLIESEQESAEREAVMDVHLYRGITTKLGTTDMVRIPIRQDRRPRNADHRAHVIFSALFEMKFSSPDVRSRAMFCTTNPQDASPYTSGEVPGTGGHVVRVFPLKSSKAAFVPNERDTLDFIEEIGDKFVWGLKDVFDQDKDFVRRDKVSRQLHTLSNGPVTGCLQQVKATIEALLELCQPGEEKAQLNSVVNTGLEAISRYTVIPATQIAQAVGHKPVELMIFDAQYYYAQINSPDHDDETIVAFDDEDFPF